jgi:hypothetical protein
VAGIRSKLKPRPQQLVFHEEPANRFDRSSFGVRFLTYRDRKHSLSSGASGVFICRRSLQTTQIHRYIADPVTVTTVYLTAKPRSHCSWKDQHAAASPNWRMQLQWLRTPRLKALYEGSTKKKSMLLCFSSSEKGIGSYGSGEKRMPPQDEMEKAGWQPLTQLNTAG